jgi:hypothetical protein
MKIFIEKDSTQNRWWVHMDVWAANFRSLEGAESFVERLNSRINAPHSPAIIGNHSLPSQKFSKSPPLYQDDLPQPAKQLSQALYT